MAHPVNPAGFRLGKTFLWSVNSYNDLKNVNQTSGLGFTTNQVLARNNLLVVKFQAKENMASKFVQVNVLYYPLVVSTFRNRVFPTYCLPRKILNKPQNYNTVFKNVLSKIWSVKTQKFNNRFVRSKIKKNINEMITKAMFTGSKPFLGSKNKFIYNKLLNNQNKWNKTSKYLKSVVLSHANLKNKWSRWRSSKKVLNAYKISKQISKRTGLRVNIKLINIFSYLAYKTKKLKFKKHQRHIWNKRYQFNKKRFTSYYDIVNSLYLLCFFAGGEHLVFKMIQYGLINMHRRKIRPKNMFYFLNSVVKNMKAIQKNFNAFRLIITGKLRGGTSRTKMFSTGFGVIPQQTLDKDISYTSGDVRSKYGAFGVKLITWRKSAHETSTDMQVKWTLFNQRRRLRRRANKGKFKLIRKNLFKVLRHKFKRALKLKTKTYK